MARRRTHEEDVRSQIVTVRLTKADHLRLVENAARQNMTPSGLAERFVVKGRLVVLPDGERHLNDKVFMELRRIGNNLNQIAHAVNSNAPPEPQFFLRQLRDLAVMLIKDEMFARRTHDLRMREATDDSEAPSARDEFQRRV